MTDHTWVFAWLGAAALSVVVVFCYLRATYTRRFIDRILRKAEGVEDFASSAAGRWHDAASTCTPLALSAIPVLLLALRASAFGAAALCLAAVAAVVTATRFQSPAMA